MRDAILKLIKYIVRYWDLITNIFHTLIGYAAVKLGFPWSILITVAFIAYESIESLSGLEYIEDLLEYAVGIAVGLATR